MNSDCKSDDEKKKIYEILNRVHQEQKEGEYSVEENLNKTFEYERLKKALDDGKEIELTPEMKAAFEDDANSGKLSHILIVPWSPWWENTLSKGETCESETVIIAEKNDDGSSTLLDDRLLRIPKFSGIYSGKCPSGALSCNLVSILCAILLTLRMFGGRENAIMNCCLEAFDTIFTSSNVLEEDMRYDLLPQALMDVHITTSSFHQPSLLFQDMVFILENKRHIAHLLIDGIDILIGAEKELKKKSGKKLHRSRVKSIRKKLEFYLSW
eukprot:CAMPEP_0194156370 /NCGR_PEP_ID=MMETSP0152-20130528/68083_1 /TAXON_ID=1049557 /ORGANISM="Thalassiothrix antarctica, Strain L6-D1" /LENGTH=268 /DNA_ID=CAMNT_0038864003 /DNA_START=146 /DNA_END=949 /DNA_ORIENTATION=-